MPLGSRPQFEFELAVEQIIFGLEGNRRREPFARRDLERFIDPRRGEVGKTGR